MELFAIHIILFMVAAHVLGLALLKMPKVVEESLLSGVALLITAITYFVLYVTEDPKWRWLGYTFACALFAAGVARLRGHDFPHTFIAGLFMSLTLFTGFVVYEFEQTYLKWLIFATGGSFYVISIVLIGWSPKGRTYWEWGYFVLFVLVWTVYPFFYAFGTAVDGPLSFENESIVYFILEFPAKLGVTLGNLVFAYLLEKGYFQEQKTISLRKK